MAALTPDLIATALADWPDTPGMGWPSWAFENHDAPRALSRWCAPDQREAFARTKMMLLAALRFLGQNPPDALAGAALAELWQWAQAHWSIATVPRRRQAAASDFS